MRARLWLLFLWFIKLLNIDRSELIMEHMHFSLTH